MRMLITAMVMLTAVAYSGDAENYHKKYKKAYLTSIQKEDDKLEKAKKQRDENVLELTKKYRGILEKIMTMHTKEGKLEKALKVRSEIEILDKMLNSGKPEVVKEESVVDKAEEVDLKKAGTVRLLGLNAVSSKAYRYKIEADAIFAHAPSRLVYDIPKNARMFTALGMPTNNSDSSKGKYAYVVKVDGKELFRGVSHRNIVEIEVKLPFGAKQIELIGDPMGVNFQDGTRWKYPRFHSRTLNIDSLKGWKSEK